MTTVSLSDEDRRLLRSVEALLRGFLANQPRPEPRGDWGRPFAPAPQGLGERIAVGRDMHPAAAVPISARDVGSVHRKRTRRKHTPESKAADARRLAGLLEELGVNARALAQLANVTDEMLYQVLRARTGISENLDEKLRAIRARLLNAKRRA